MIRESVDFYFVWTKKGRKPYFTHSSFEAAEAEAQRLAGLSPGHKYIVLHGVTKYHVEK